MASTLTVDNIVGASSSSTIHIPGHIIGYVNHDYNTQQVISSTSYITTGLTVSYAAKSANSKLRISYQIPCEQYDGNSNAEVIGQTTLYIDGSVNSTSYTGLHTMENMKRSGSTIGEEFTLNASDTNSHTYTIYAKTTGQQLTIFRYSLVGSLSIMEIAQ
tara:strand:+ start:10 stop:489 length:480 start_codon:yes stop_codon:yes gene_type:complete